MNAGGRNETPGSEGKGLSTDVTASSMSISICASVLLVPPAPVLQYSADRCCMYSALQLESTGHGEPTAFVVDKTVLSDGG